MDISASEKTPRFFLAARAHPRRAMALPPLPHATVSSGSTARLLAAMLGDLGVSTLRSIKTMTRFS
jgi:hypothetical protein